MLATNDLDYLAARLHARRSRLAEGEQLVDLCRVRGIPDLGRAVRPADEFSSVADFQRGLLAGLIQEFSFCLQHLTGAKKQVIGWMQSRFQIENFKVLLRGGLNRAPREMLEPHLVPLPRELAVDVSALSAAETPAAFASQLPAGRPRLCLEKFIASQPGPPDAFLCEAALDSGYFCEGQRRVAQLAAGEAELITPLVRQATEQFHLLLAVRGKFLHGYPPATLEVLRVTAEDAAGSRFKAMLAAPDLPTVARLGLGHVFDDPPALRSAGETSELDPAEFESLAARRLLRLANTAFRRSHLGFATVVAYLELRRIEVANLITISEGIRLGAPPESLPARLVRRASFIAEVRHV
jgi:vacuolar-type H+-ATPase subunit C/Vma6